MANYFVFCRMLGRSGYALPMGGGDTIGDCTMYCRCYLTSF